MKKPLLVRRDASNYLREHGFPIAPSTLQKYATVGGGPPYRIFGNRALYSPDDLDNWAEKKMSAPRSSSSEAM